MVETGRGGFFGQEHEQFRASVRGFIERDVAPHVDAWEEARLFPRELFNKYGEEGLLGITHDEAYGGLGLDFWFAVCAAEEMVHSRCAGLNMAMLVQSDIATPILNNLGTPEQKEEFLRPAISGERIAALAVTEAHAGSDVASILTTAKREGDDYLVNGSKTFITNGTRADFLTLILKTDPEAGHGGFSVLLFPTDTKGYSVGRSLKKIGNWSSDTAEIFFDNCRVPARNLLGQEGRGFYYLMEQFQQERLAASVGAIATAQQCLVEAIEYGRSRSCFGRPIGKFQVWRHEFAQLLTEVEAGRRLVYHAVDLFVRGQPCVREVSMSKIYCCELANKVIDRCLQFHGGWGYMDEYKISRSWRDARLWTIGAGTTEVMREIIAKLEGL